MPGSVVIFTRIILSMTNHKKKHKKVKKLGKNTFIQTVLRLFVENPHKGFNFRQVASALGIEDKASKNLVKGILEKLTANGEIVEARRGKYQIHPERVMERTPQSVIEGRVDMKQTGKAYILNEELDEDVFISANNTHHALHGDRVKVHLFPRRSGRKLEGQVIEIVERKIKQIVGTMQVTKKFAFLLPDSPQITVDIFIPLAQVNRARNGDKAIARITEWPEHSNNPFGEIIEVLGKPGDNDVEMNSILASFDFPLHFPKSVLKDANKIPEEIPAREIRKRRDIRAVWTATIDPADAKDFDDALSLQKLDSGNWEVGVHIADVGYYVQPGTAIDNEAFERGTSIYLVDRTIPMLPEKLSNKVCSLRPDEDKLAFSAIFELDEEAKVVNEWFGKTVIRSNRRYHYREVQDILDGADGDYSDSLMVLHQLALKMRAERYQHGAINFKSQEVKFELDEKGVPLSAYIKEQLDSNRLIEDFMLLANRRVAEKIGRKRGNVNPKTFVYRIHDEPNPERLSALSEFVAKLGYKLSTGSRKTLARSFNQLFENVAGKGEENMVEKIALRTMAKAEYATDNVGHYGLGFTYYTHFTSPIRRYPDLMVHRLLESYLDSGPSVDKEEYERMCVHASQMERKAIEAERASVKYKQAEYLIDKIGEEFDGLISGVSKWGVYVELDGNKCEGMVSLKDMQDDFYYLDEENYRVIGQRYGQEYRLGDPVKVLVKRVDLQKKQMDFEMVE